MISSKNAVINYLDAENHIFKDVKVLNSFIMKSNETMEGNCFYLDKYVLDDSNMLDRRLIYKRANMYSLIKERSVKKMIEIGFNAGHSASIFLHALPKDSVFLSFDICEHSYTKDCFTYLASKYSQMKPMIEGDSTITMAKYIEENPSEIGTYDVIHVDGGHSMEVCTADLNNSHILLKPGGILILDDVQDEFIQQCVLALQDIGYVMLLQIPTIIYPHIFFEKPL